MNLTDYGWNTVQAITHKQPTEIKLLIHEIEYPRLERDSRGYVLHLSEPTRPRENLLSLHGMFFDDDTSGRASLWRMFRASLYHMCLHALYTDFSIYKNVTKDSRPNNTIFAVSLVEDYAMRGHMRASWPGLVMDTAYANHICALRCKELGAHQDIALMIASNLLFYSMVGKPLVPIGNPIGTKTNAIHTKLKDLDEVAFRFSKTVSGNTLLDTDELLSDLNKKKIVTAASILELFDQQAAYLSNVPSIPYTDSYGPNLLFESSTITSESDDRSSFFNDAMKEMSTKVSSKKLEEASKSAEVEGQNILSDWGYSFERRNNLIDTYKTTDSKTHFEDFVFPSDDYAEFVRTRTRLIGSIRLVLDQLRLIKTTNEEVQGKESGYIDIPLAIQVIASRSQRNDVFVQDELDNRGEAWVILVDSSKSLESIQGQVRDVTVCLTEVARDLILNPYSWACYAFNEKMYIVKDFPELYGNECRGRIGGLPSGIKTYLPDALRFAAKRLIDCTEEIKVMLVASDGYPLGYEGIDQQLIEAIDDVKRMGIFLIGLGIGSSLIKKYFRPNCVINSPADLMKNFVRIYMEFSKSF